MPHSDDLPGTGSKTGERGVSGIRGGWFATAAQPHSDEWPRSDNDSGPVVGEAT